MTSARIPQSAVLVGFAALVPLPLVDELVRRYLLKSCFEEQAKAAGRPLDPGEGWALARQRSNLIVGCLLAVFWWPIKKFFRLILFFLIVKDVMDWAADAVIRAAMVRRALERGLLPGRTEAVWAALDGAADAHCRSPAVRALLDAGSPPPPLWTSTQGGLDPLFAWLARWGRGHAALAAFDVALDGLAAEPAQLAGPVPDPAPSPDA